MPSTQPLTDSIVALTTYANSVTGASDTTLSDAVDTLAAGYGGGGGSGYSIDDVAAHNFSGAVVLNSATKIEQGAFASSAITSVSGSAPTQVKAEAFRYCASLESINLPNVTKVSIANYAFANCGNLLELLLPKLSDISSSTYLCYGDSKLAIADLGVIGNMINNFFNGCTLLRKLVLRKTGSICTTNWASAAVFGGIYNNPTESTIYVPQSLISSYQAASNWSTLYNMGVTFAKIEGSQYEL